MHKHDTPRVARLARRCARAIPIVTALALGLALAGCDHCGDFFWQTQHGACHLHPDPK
jgi:hypothetical protein